MRPPFMLPEVVQYTLPVIAGTAVLLCDAAVRERRCAVAFALYAPDRTLLDWAAWRLSSALNSRHGEYQALISGLLAAAAYPHCPLLAFTDDATLADSALAPFAPSVTDRPWHLRLQAAFALHPCVTLEYLPRFLNGACHGLARHALNHHCPLHHTFSPG